MRPCPHLKELRSLLNMTPQEIRSWAHSRQACAPRRRANGRTAVAELKTLARLLVAQSKTSEDCKKARDAVAFVKRHEAGRLRDSDPCSLNRVIALRDWGYHPVGCPIPTKTCKRGEKNVRIK